MTIVHKERTGTHKKDSFSLEAKRLRTAQNAAYEFAGGPQSKAQGILRSASWIFKQEPAEMPFYSLCGPTGLRADKARYIGSVVF
jgi:hypothetical protein